MKNAHERFGWLEFTRVMKDTTARVRVRLDRCIAEPTENGISRVISELVKIRVLENLCHK